MSKAGLVLIAFKKFK